MTNYLFKARYDGSFFHGWQMQKNSVTVQGEITRAFERIFQTNVTVNGCSRTDAGVHAEQFCFNVKLETDMTERRIVEALNSVLPRSVAVYSCVKVEEDFHARFDCRGKEYVYRILNSPQRNPFFENRAYHYKYPIDVKLLNEQARYFVGKHDFKSFCASGSEVESTERTIFDFTVERQGEAVVFTVSGDGFLYNMVRIMVGTLLDVGRGKIDRGTIPDIIEKKDRNYAGVTAPACGLYLNKVFYGDEYE